MEENAQAPRGHQYTSTS